MTLRSPKKLDEYKTYWRLAVKGKMAEAEAWRAANERSMSLWDDTVMPFPGFYRNRKAIPIAFWLEVDRDEAGDMMGPAFLVMRTGIYPPQVEADLITFGHLSFVMTWERCRTDAVTEAAYLYALEHYDRETDVYPWADRLPKPMREPRIDLRNAPSVF